jgi:hypothetical protein
MTDDIWEYYAKDMMFESHKEPHYITQQYIKHLEKERDKWRKLALAEHWLRVEGHMGCDCLDEAVRGDNIRTA